jgi:hypothetical protein
MSNTDDRSESGRLRAELVRAGGAAKGRGSGYPLATRARVVAFAAERRRRGAGIVTIAAELGLSATTLKKWMRGSEPGSAFAPVEIVDQQAIVLISPGGWRAEIDLETFAKLIGRT